jgi:hypothetical protein
LLLGGGVWRAYHGVTFTPPLNFGFGYCRGSLPPAVNFYRSHVGLGWLAQETTGFMLVRASEE